jgi:hypothetical protein
MSKRNAVFLTLGQVALGGVIGLASGWVCLFILQHLIWGALIGERIQHGFWIGAFLLITFGAAYGCAVVGAGEGVRLVGQRFGVSVDRNNAYRGAFLGAPAVVALISLLNIQWGAIIAPNMLIYLLLPVVHLISYIVSLPVRIFVDWLNFPPELLYVLAVPIGAILGYRIDWSHNRHTEPTVAEN